MVQRPDDDFEIFDEEEWRASSRGDMDNQLKRAVFEELRIDHLYNGDQPIQSTRGTSMNQRAGGSHTLTDTQRPDQLLHSSVSNSGLSSINLELLKESGYTPEEQMTRHMNGSYDWLMTMSDNAATSADTGDMAPQSQRDGTIYGCNIMSFSGKRAAQSCGAVAAWAEGDTLINLIASPLAVEKKSMYTSAQILSSRHQLARKSNPEQGSAAEKCPEASNPPTVRSATGHFPSSSKVKAMVGSKSPKSSIKSMKTLPRGFKLGKFAALQSSSDTCTDEDHEMRRKRSSSSSRGKEGNSPSIGNRTVGTGSLRDSPAKGKSPAATVFELPGDAVARRLRAQREARRERQAAEAAKSQQQQVKPRWR